MGRSSGAIVRRTIRAKVVMVAGENRFTDSAYWGLVCGETSAGGVGFDMGVWVEIFYGRNVDVRRQALRPILLDQCGGGCLGFFGWGEGSYAVDDA